MDTPTPRFPRPGLRARGPLGVFLGMALLATLGTAPESSAQGLYRYIDDRGVVHFTNRSPVDTRYRRIRMTPQGVRSGRVDLRARPPVHHGFDGLVRRAASAYRLQPALVKAVIAAESNFDPRARSRKGAMGLMQLMPATARALGVAEPYDPAENVFGGSRYLRTMLDRYGDVARALAAYNAGPTAVDRHRGIPPYRETRTYVERVLEYYRGYGADFAPALSGARRAPTRGAQDARLGQERALAQIAP